MKIRTLSVALVAVTAATIATTTLLPSANAEQRYGATDPTRPGPLRVSSLVYTLGDAAFTVPGFPRSGGEGIAPLELTGVIHFPTDRARGPRPVVVLSHGLWWTCADRAAEKEYRTLSAQLEAATTDAERERIGELLAPPTEKLAQWPCAKGTPQLPSFRGYDYLGKQLASHGIVAISIGANGVNAGGLGEIADMARAAMINKHLAMWSELTNTGGGPLARVVRRDFRGQLDMARVGTVGHSRGGRGVVWHAADANRKDLPKGVKLLAAFPLAPAGVPLLDDGDGGDEQREIVSHYQVRTTPLAYWLGTHDGATSGGPEIAEIIEGRSKTPITGFTVHGANHNFLNTQWSPSSGQVMAENDSPKPDGLLTEAAERTVSTGLLTAFFRRHLLNDRQFDGLLTGRDHPLERVTKIDVKLHQPGETPPAAPEPGPEPNPCEGPNPPPKCQPTKPAGTTTDRQPDPRPVR